MKETKEILTGRIERCLDIYHYTMYGKEHVIPDFELGHITCSTLHRYTQTAYEGAILLKIDEENYIWLNAPDEQKNPLSQRLDVLQKHITTTPEKEKRLYKKINKKHEKRQVEPYLSILFVLRQSLSHKCLHTHYLYYLPY